MFAEEEFTVLVVPEEELVVVRVYFETRISGHEPVQRRFDGQRSEKNVMNPTRDDFVLTSIDRKSRQIKSNVFGRREWPRQITIDESEETNKISSIEHDGRDQKQDEQTNERRTIDLHFQ